jgi:amidase
MEDNPNSIHTLKDVIRYSEATPEEEPDTWGMKTLKGAIDAGDATDKDKTRFVASEKLRLHVGMEVARLLDKYECDILVVPMWTEATSAIGGNPQIAAPMPAHPLDWPIPAEKKYGLVSTGPNIPYVCPSISSLAARPNDKLTQPAQASCLLGVDSMMGRSSAQHMRMSRQLTIEISLLRFWPRATI